MHGSRSTQRDRWTFARDRWACLEPHIQIAERGGSVEAFVVAVGGRVRAHRYTHAVVLEALDLLARLAALVPPPRFHMLRYHGVLASNSSARAEVVPMKPDVDEMAVVPTATLSKRL